MWAGWEPAERGCRSQEGWELAGPVQLFIWLMSHTKAARRHTRVLSARPNDGGPDTALP